MTKGLMNTAEALGVTLRTPPGGAFGEAAYDCKRKAYETVHYAEALRLIDCRSEGDWGDNHGASHGLSLFWSVHSRRAHASDGVKFKPCSMLQHLL